MTNAPSPDATTDSLANPGANVGVGGADPVSCISGPDTLLVGQAGVFTAPGVDPYTWTPDKEGVFEVVLDDGAGGVCTKSVTVSPGAGAPATDAPTDVPAPTSAPLGTAAWDALAGIVG